MPGTYDTERNGKGRAERKLALLNRANTATTDVRTWSEYFTQKKNTVVSTVVSTGVSGVKHAALHTFAKVAVFTVGFAAGGYLAAIGGAIATLVGGGFFWGLLGKPAQEALTDYGAGVIDDWVKYGGETVSGKVYDKVTGPSAPSTTGLTSSTGAVTIQDEMATVCASVGVLAALMAKSEELRAAPVAYCDDAYAQARLIKRIEDEMVHLFNGSYDGDVLPDQAEVLDYRWVSKDWLLKDLAEHSDAYTYWFRHYVHDHADAIFP